jgi:hypothetical protein
VLSLCLTKHGEIGGIDSFIYTNLANNDQVYTPAALPPEN